MPHLTINENEIWYQRSGHGRPILFLHAFAVSGEMWLPQLPTLVEAEYEVICVDLRGHGSSSAQSGFFTISQMADDIHQLINKLSLDQFCVVGLSMGGRVALRLALDYPQDIAALVLVSAKSEPAREIKTELEALAKRAEQGNLGGAVADWFTAHYQRLFEYAPELTNTLLEEWQKKSANGFAGAARAISEMESMTPRVSEISNHTLSVVGSLDTPCHPFMAWYERSMPDCRGVIVPDAHHFVNIEQSEQFNDLLLSFLSA
jgi:3-oxoadipate enol-lactonase